MKMFNKKIGRLLSVFLAAVIILPAAAFGSLKADAVSTVDITIDKVTRKYKEAAKWLGYINELRAEQNLPTLVMDETLFETAMVRSAELMVYVGSTRLDGTQFVDGGTGFRSEFYSYGQLLNRSSIVNTSNTTIMDSKVKSIGIGYTQSSAGIKYITILSTADEPQGVSSESLDQSNATIDQPVKCKTSYLTNMTLNFLDNYKLTCGNKAYLKYVVTNQGDSSIKQNISAPSTVTSSDTNVFAVNEDNTIIGVAAGYATVKMSMKADTSVSVQSDLQAVVKTFQDCSVSPIPDQLYSGSALTPAVTVTNDKTGVALRVGTDYVLTYVNNINVGTGCVVITGAGSYANRTTSASFKIINNPKAFGATLTVNKDDMENGETAKLTAASVNGTGTVKYLYEYCIEGTSTYTTIQSASTATSCSFKPTSAGLYHLRVTATDSAGKKATAAADLNVHLALKTSVSLSSTQASVGNTITIRGSASGGISPYTYQVSVMVPGSNSYKTIKDFNTTNSCTYSPTASGSHTIRFTSKDNYGSTSFATAVLTVTGGTFYNRSTISSEAVKSGESVILTGVGEGGTGGYTYTYMYKLSSASSWTTVGTEYGKSTSAVIIPVTVGTYNAKVNVKDGDGTIKSKSFTFTVSEANTTLANNSSLSASTITLGSRVTLNGGASGGTSPYKYAFYYKKTTGSSWTTAGTEYGTDTTASIKPAVSTTYDIMINVKDSKNNIKSKYFTLTVKASALVNKSTVSPTSVEVGSPVTLKAAATGGTGKYTYALLYKKSTADKWSCIGTKYGTASTGTFTPSKAVEYSVMINVKDSAGTIKSKTFTVNVSANPLVNNSTVSSTSVKLGTTVTLNGAASGGTGKYTYALLYKKSTAEKWSCIGTKYGTASSGSFTPSKAVDYSVMINVKDSTGTVKSKTFTVKVAATTLVNSSTVSSTNVNTGTAVTLNGAASGGTGSYTYALLYKRQSATSWTCIGTKYGKESKGSFNPGKNCVYDIKINVKDSAGTIKSKTFTVYVSGGTLLNKSTLSSASITCGTKVTIKGAATGGTMPYKYTYYYKKSSATSWTTLGTENTTNTEASFTPGSATTYNIKVVIKDAKGTAASKSLTLTVK